jgi:integral membrane sensor domain MASE1/signal transduction histidine kinase
MTAVALRIASIPHAARLALLALAYFAAAKASLVFAIPPGYATAVWLPSGIAFAAVILWGVRCWPGLWLGAALANFTINLSWSAAIGIATGNTLEALCAAVLAARVVDRSAGFRRPEAVFLFAAIAALASTIAASVGVSVLYLTGAVAEGSFFANWYTWWQGDATGILVVAPCALAWAGAARPMARSLHRYELDAFGVLFVAALLAVFAWAPGGGSIRAIAFLTIPFFAWAACRYEERVVASSVLVATALAVWCTVNGRGPFASDSLNESLLTLQAFTSTGALFALALGTFTRQRELALRTLRVSNDVLDAAVRVQGVALGARERKFARLQEFAHFGHWQWDARSGRMAWSDELCRIYGIEPGGFDGGFEDYLARVDARDRDRIRALLQGALFDRRSWEAVERIVRPDGTMRVLHSCCNSGGRRQGGPARLWGVSLDITDRVRLEQIQAAQHEIGLALARSPSVGDAERATLRIVGDKLDWDSARYWRVDTAAGGLRMAAAHTALGSQEPNSLGSRADGGLAVRAWRERRALSSRDAALRAGFAFPVTSGGEVLGVIELGGGPRGDPEIELAEMATATGVLLGEFSGRSRTQERLRESQARLGELARRLFDAHDAERREVAAELRDGIEQPLAVAHASLGLAQLEAPLAAARELVARLRPASLGDYGLLAALRAYAGRFERRTGIEVEVTGSEDGREIAPRLQSALYQIARDVLDAVARQSQVRSVAVRCDVRGGSAALSIRDDGPGFDPQAPESAAVRDLAVVRERAAAIDARLHVVSRPGHGTHVSVRVRM